MNGAGALGQRLRWARMEQGVTLQQLSERCGKAVSYICQLERGNKDNPTRQTVEALATALGVRPAFLFGEVPSPLGGETSQAQRRRAELIGQRFRQHWGSLAEESRFELTYAETGQRWGAVARFLLDQFREEFTPMELAWQLGMSMGQFRAILEKGEEVSVLFMEQLSRLSGVPLSFLTHGSLEPVEPSDHLLGEVRQYMEAIRLAQERQVSPEKLKALIEAACS